MTQVLREGLPPPSQNSVELLVMNVADDSGYSVIISMLQIECIL